MNPFNVRTGEQMGMDKSVEVPDFIRAGNCECEICGKEFYKHQSTKFGEGSFGLTLWKICDGRWVKL